MHMGDLLDVLTSSVDNPKAVEKIKYIYVMNESRTTKTVSSGTSDGISQMSQKAESAGCQGFGTTDLPQAAFSSGACPSTAQS